MFGSRTGRGFVYGVAATIAMSVLAVIGTVAGVSPLPKPTPKAIVVAIIGSAPEPVVIGLAIGSHLVYGGLFGALLAKIARPVTLTKALALGVSLWGFLQVLILPFLGWGAFGTAIDGNIAVATLVSHLVYGGVLGWAMTRGTPSVDTRPASAAD